MAGLAITCLMALASIVPPAATQPPALIDAPARQPAPRSISLTQLDRHVLANLLTEVPARRPDSPLTVVAGEITLCQSATCTVPLTLRASGAEGPVTLAFAVANAKGELSQVQHAPCGIGACNISLVLERGPNVVSIGLVDPIARTTAYTTLRIDADRTIPGKPGRTAWF